MEDGRVADRMSRPDLKIKAHPRPGSDSQSNLRMAAGSALRGEVPQDARRKMGRESRLRTAFPVIPNPAR